LADYRQAIARPGTDVALVLKVHPSNYRIEGFAEETPVAELATLGVPVVVDIGSGLLDADVPWLHGPPPAWLAGEPAARQTLVAGAGLVTFSADKLLGGPQAGIVVGCAELVEQCARHPLARALRPGGLVLGALQDLALAYLRRDVADVVPFWRMVAAAVAEVDARARDVVARANRGDVVASDALPGAGSAPGATIPSRAVRLTGDRLAELRDWRRGDGTPGVPVIARARDGATFLDLRSVDPVDDDTVVEALCSLA
jgi:L-seryl-tRNA(Ser) seleniumtransferase